MLFSPGTCTLVAWVTRSIIASVQTAGIRKDLFAKTAETTLWSIISTQSKQNSKIHRPVYQGPRCVRIMKITGGRKFRDTLPYCRNFNFFKVNIRFRILNNKSFQRHVLWKETEVCCNNYWNNFILLYYITILLYIILLYYYITLYNLLEQLYIFVKQPYYQIVLNCLRLLTVLSVFIFPFHLLVCEVFF